MVAGIGGRAATVELGMGHGIIVLLLFVLAIAHGWLWSIQERRKAVQAAYDDIRKEVRRERQARNRNQPRPSDSRIAR